METALLSHLILTTRSWSYSSVGVQLPTNRFSKFFHWPFEW